MTQDHLNSSNRKMKASSPQTGDSNLPCRTPAPRQRLDTGPASGRTVGSVGGGRSGGLLPRRGEGARFGIPEPSRQAGMPGTQPAGVPVPGRAGAAFSVLCSRTRRHMAQPQLHCRWPDPGWEEDPEHPPPGSPGPRTAAQATRSTAYLLE